MLLQEFYMSNFRNLSISISLIITTTSTFASTIDNDFQRCAAVAMQESGQTVNKIVIDNGGLKKGELDHDLSPFKSEYRMEVVDKRSGEKIGVVTCSLSRSGNVINSSFDPLTI
jgi:hypothetical protein